MKPFIRILSAIILISFIAFTSCTKDLAPQPDIVDSVKAVLPKQIIYNLDTEDTLYVSFKYDTVNNKVEIYENDPSTPDLYDKLAITFTFNKAGYLVTYVINSTKFYNSSFENAVVNINRTSDNTISYIAYDDRDFNRKDTTFYTYQRESSGIKITTIGRESYFEDTTTYRYDNSYNLMEVKGVYDYANYHYNPNMSINKITGKGLGDNVTDFAYGSGIPDAEEDWLARLLVGKDHYILDIMDLNPFVFYLDPDYDNYSVSATNRFHLTRMTDTHQPDGSPTGIENATMKYELNDRKLLSKIVFITEADGPYPAFTETIQIKY